LPVVIPDVIGLLNIHIVAPDVPMEGPETVCCPKARITAPSGITVKKIKPVRGGKSRRKYVVICYAVTT
jgi:hypothetical protein